MTSHAVVITKFVQMFTGLPREESISSSSFSRNLYRLLGAITLMKIPGSHYEKWRVKFAVCSCKYTNERRIPPITYYGMLPTFYPCV